ncbi:MAG: hypothetical protein EA398_07130 [Deltaproteobacteria bacterium]|nr:MAG: hypothetical protein EA398_07130 [Deltaproteobacteria bacterium]
MLLAAVVVGCGGGGSTADGPEDCARYFEPVGPEVPGGHAEAVPVDVELPETLRLVGRASSELSFPLLGLVDEESGALEILVPFDPLSRGDGPWMAQVDVEGEGFSCVGLELPVLPMPAPADPELVLGQLEELVDLAMEYAEVMVTSELDVPEGNPLEAPLEVARRLLEEDENSLRAVLEGRAPALAGEEVDLVFLGQLFAVVGLPELLEDALEEMRALVAAEKRLGGCLTHPFHPQTVEDLRCWIRASQAAAAVTDGVLGQVLNGIGILLNLVALIPHPATRAAASGAAVTLAIGQLVADALSDMLPSRLLPLQVVLSPAEFEEDSDAVGRLARVDLLAQNNGYELRMARIVDILMLATGLGPALRAMRSSRNVTEQQRRRIRDLIREGILEQAEDALLVVATGIYQALIGLVDSIGGPELFQSRTIGPVDANDAQYTELMDDIPRHQTLDPIWIDRDARTYGANWPGSMFVRVRLRDDVGFPQSVEGRALARVNRMEVEIQPDPLRVSPGADGRFFVTVRNATDDGGDWSATVGEMGINGRYTAPDSEGVFADAVRFESTATGGARSHPDAQERVATATVITEDCCGSSPPAHCDPNQCDCPSPPDPELCEDSTEDFEEECGRFADAGGGLDGFEGGVFSPGFDPCLCPDPPEECEPPSDPDPSCETDCPPPPRPPPLCTGPCSNFRGDPWLRSFDGLFFGFQAVGEFILTRSTEDEYEIQVRTVPLSDSVSVTSMIGVRMGEHRLTLGLDREPALHVDGAPEALSDGFVELGGGVRVWRERNTWHMTRADGLRVSARIAFGEVMVDQELPPSLVGRVEGLAGDADGDASNDLRVRGASVPLENAMDHDVLYGEFGESWRISDGESLLDYGPGEDTAFHTDRSYPRLEPDLSTMSDEEIAAAEAICRAAGITRNPWLEACIIDVILRGEEAVGAFGGVRQPTRTVRALRAPLSRGAALGNPVDLVRDSRGFAVADNDGRVLRVDRDGAVSVIAEDPVLVGLSTLVPWEDGWVAATAFGIVASVGEGGAVQVLVDDPRFAFNDLVHDGGSAFTGLHMGFEDADFPGPISSTSSIVTVDVSSGSVEPLHTLDALADVFRMRRAEDGTFWVTDQELGVYTVSAGGSVARAPGQVGLVPNPLDVELLAGDRVLVGLRDGRVLELARGGSTPPVAWASVAQFPVRLLRFRSTVVAADFGDFEGSGTVWRLSRVP